MGTRLKKKLRGGPVIDVDPQIIRWRAKRKKLGLYKAARKPKVATAPAESSITHEKAPPLQKQEEVNPPVAKTPPKDIWDVFK